MRGVDAKMTDRSIYKSKWGDFALCFLGVFLIALMIRNSDVAIKYVKDGLSLSASVLIPSLFPFMVVSDIFVRSGAARTLGSLLSAPMRTLFGIRGEGAVAVVLGALCGFPIGARCAVSLFDSGRISGEECERLMALSSNPSSAFLISAVGVSLFGSRAFGRVLYIATLASSATVGVVAGALSRRRAKKAPSERPLDTPRESLNDRFRASDISDAIASSADAMLRVCAFVVFFVAFTGTLCEMLDALPLSQTLKAAVCGIFELTGGVTEAAKLRPVEIGGVLAAFASGWSGLSVLLQISSICRGREISLLPYVISKLATGVLTASVTALCLRLSPPEFYADAPTVLLEVRGAHIITAAFVVISIAVGIKKIIAHRRERKI